MYLIFNDIVCKILTVSSQEIFKLHFSSYIGDDCFQQLKLEQCLNLNMLIFDLKQSRATHGLATSYNNFCVCLMAKEEKKSLLFFFDFTHTNYLSQKRKFFLFSISTMLHPFLFLMRHTPQKKITYNPYLKKPNRHTMAKFGIQTIFRKFFLNSMGVKLFSQLD